MERIAKADFKKAEDLQTMEKKFAKKKPTEADTKKLEELKAQILVNEPSQDRCGYFAVRCFAAMFQRYTRFEMMFRALEIRANIWRTVKTKWVAECNILSDTQAREAWLNDQNWGPAVEAWLAAHKLLDGFVKEPLPVPNLEQLDHIRAAIDNLDLEIYRDNIFDAHLKKNLSIDSLGAVPQKLRPTCILPVQMDATSFQLRRLGERFQRDAPSTLDPRVVFNADQWQRDLMNIVDNRGSVIVSAPTSSGKTFISYYCMEQVFSQVISQDTPTSDIGVVVYVAPTRALINQAAADIYGRYKSKTYNNLPVHIFGVLGGRDYVRTPFDCQALITLPDVLETILLSPHNQKWLKRVKYFIFDEIHTMENSGNGAVWERLLSLIRAPFVALSATIGDTQNLLSWLNRVQERQAEQAAATSAANEQRIYNVSLIPKEGTTIARWSDIEKHVFIPTTTQPLSSLDRDEVKVDRSDIVPFHPLSVANYETITRKGGFPADLGIVPRETLELVEQMFTVFKPICEEEYSDIPCVQTIAERLLALRADTYFAGLLHISQTKAREWEAKAKKQLLDWVTMGTSEGCDKLGLDLGPLADDDEQKELFAGRMQAIAREILSTFSAKALDRENHLLAKARLGEIPYPDTTDFIHQGIMRCLFTLVARNMSPSIIFVLDQEECEQLVDTVVTALEEAENKFRSTPSFIRFVAQMDAAKEKNDRLKATQRSMTYQSEGGDDRNQGSRTVDSVGNIRPDSDFIIPDILPQFTFAPMIASDDDIKTALEENPNEKDSILFRALRRGIGLHHNGITGRLRGSVERSFRKLQLPFVFSTEGLALGIHSPCRTVVLAGDNIALNVAEFRQMAGRAGRRGLDFLGHVVFFGISFKKIKRLMTGEMANLRGHSQIDPATSLRLLELYNTRFDAKPGQPTPAEWHKQVNNIAELAYVDPLFVRGRAESRNYCTDHIALLRHLMTYFAREGLVNLNAREPSSIGNLLVTMLNIRNNVRLETSAFSIVSMMVNQFLDKAAFIDPADPNSPDPASQEHTRQRFSNVAMALSYVLTTHYRYQIPLEVHRSIARDALVVNMKKLNASRTHIVYLPNPTGPVAEALKLQTTRMLMVLSHFIADRARLIETDVTLPLGILNKKGEIVSAAAIETSEDATGLAAALAATANPDVKARHPLIAISGKTDNFESTEDLGQSLANGLFLDISDIPAIDLADLGRHDGSPVHINACFYDYVRNGSQKRGENMIRLNLLLYNGLTQSSSWGALNKAFTAMDSLKIALDFIAEKDSSNETKTAVEVLAKRCAELKLELDNKAQYKIELNRVAEALNV
eukprot:GILJ01015697.1.p1 GENE.GILJ01015697.1~~GILJ01015697.1.p1  ORF type:complete len:1516 (+),score=340.80 GILJ01015697.1:587-4549(+)